MVPTVMESHGKKSCHGKSWKLKNREKSHGKVMELVRVATLDRYCENSYSY